MGVKSIERQKIPQKDLVISGTRGFETYDGEMRAQEARLAEPPRRDEIHGDAVGCRALQRIELLLSVDELADGSLVVEGVRHRDGWYANCVRFGTQVASIREG